MPIFFIKKMSLFFNKIVLKINYSRYLYGEKLVTIIVQDISFKTRLKNTPITIEKLYSANFK
jgi:hypothetical protein